MTNPEVFGIRALASVHGLQKRCKLEPKTAEVCCCLVSRWSPDGKGQKGAGGMGAKRKMHSQHRQNDLNIMKEASFLLTVELFLLTVRLFTYGGGTVSRKDQTQFSDGGTESRKDRTQFPDRTGGTVSKKDQTDLHCKQKTKPNYTPK